MWLARGRRWIGAGLLAGGVLMIAVPLVATGVLGDSGKEHTVTVVGLDPETSPPFTVEISHVLASHGDEFYSFRDAGDLEHVLATFQAQHPAGVRTDARSPTEGDMYRALWHVSTDTMRFELVEDHGHESFAVITQVGYIAAADDSMLRLPWPSTAYGAITLSEETTLVGDWTADQWRDFYADIGEARIVGDTITVPTDSDATVTLTLNGTDVTFTINP